MDKRAVLTLSRKLLSRYKHTAVRTARHLLPKRKQLVFVFGGRTQYWPGIGRELYEQEPVFRKYIHACDAIFQEIEGVSILANFEGPLDGETLSREYAMVLTLSAVQVALFEMWKEKGIHPHAVMGLSLGESLAAYAAGALDLKDALRICIEGARISKLEAPDYIPFYIQSDIATINAVAKQCPAFIAPIYEAGEQGVLALCHKDQKEIAVNFLTDNGFHWNIPHKETTWPYHTHLIQKHRKAITKNYVPTEASPMQCDFYSCTTGGVIPKNSIINNEFWFDIKCRPVLTHSALRAVAQGDFDLMMHIGPASLQKGQMLRSAGQWGRGMEMLDTLRKGEPELQVIAATQRRIAASRLLKIHAINGDAFSGFLQQLNFDSAHVQADPYPYFDFLRKHGSVHFLPVHNTWIVLDYQDIDHALKQPQLFSSTLHKTFDECLVGADPPSHTLVRTMLQPLFSAQVFASLGAFTTEHAHALLDKLPGKRQFNVVNEFSLPLAQAVVAELLGLSGNEAQALQQCVKGHVYAMEHLDSMYHFFKKYLEECKSPEKNSAAALLLNAVKEEKITTEGAIKLMRLLWVAGMTTTSMLLSTAIHFIARDGKLREQLRGNDQLMGRFIDECLRLEAPELDLKRITKSPTTLAGKNIPAGSIVMLSLAAANRDPKYFEQPEDILLDRPAKQHMSFGGGYHYCLGVGMAKLEAKYALKVILERLPALQLDANTSPTYFPSPHFRGLKTLEVCTNE